MTDGKSVHRFDILSFYINYGNKTATNQRANFLTIPIIVLNIF